MITIASFDDGCAEDLRLADLLAKYEIETTFYIPSDWHTYNLREGREPLTVDAVENIAEEFEIGSHTVSHALLTRVPLAQAEREIVESKHQLEHLIGCPIMSFCYPRGYANDAIRDIVRENYETARNTLVGNIQESPDPVWTTPTVHICGKRRPEYENTTWLKEAYRLLEQAVNTPDSIFHMWGHSWEISRYDGWHDFEELLSEVSSA